MGEFYAQTAAMQGMQERSCGGAARSLNTALSLYLELDTRLVARWRRLGVLSLQSSHRSPSSI